MNQRHTVAMIIAYYIQSVSTARFYSSMLFRNESVFSKIYASKENEGENIVFARVDGALEQRL